MRLAAFYHCWAAGRWREPTSLFLDALIDGEFPGPLYVGLVGSDEQRAEAIAEIRERWPAEIAAEAEFGYEQVTMHALHEYAKRNDGAVVYAHTKGAWHGGNRVEVLRELVNQVVRRWRSRALSLGGGAEVTGDPDSNVWMARCDFVRTLPPCRTHNERGELCRGFAQAGLGGWFETGSRMPRGASAEALLTRTGFRADGGPAEPLYLVNHLTCPTCGACRENLDSDVDLLVIDSCGDPLQCRREHCLMQAVGRRLLRLQQELGRPPDLEDVLRPDGEFTAGSSSRGARSASPS